MDLLGNSGNDRIKVTDEVVSPQAGLLDVVGLQRKPVTALREIRQMHREVSPEGPVVPIDVVVWILTICSNRKYWSVHMHVLFCSERTRNDRGRTESNVVENLLSE